MIQIVSLLFENGIEEESEQYEIFVSLWFSYLKMVLNYVKCMRSLSKLNENNLVRILNVLIKDKKILKEKKADDSTSDVWNKSWEAISSFYPKLKESY